jgi:hypothetical protein
MRGHASKEGSTRVSPNGYHYTRTAKGWKLTGRVVAEQKLGRELEPSERIRFIDNNRLNLDPNNIEVYTTNPSTPAKRRARIEAKIADLMSKLEELDGEAI